MYKDISQNIGVYMITWWTDRGWYVSNQQGSYEHLPVSMMNKWFKLGVFKNRHLKQSVTVIIMGYAPPRSETNRYIDLVTCDFCIEG